MKVQCGQCPAKYAVADERLRDKKVRIHCKRCNAAIVVDGKVDPPLVTSTPARKSAHPRPSQPAEALPPVEEREPASRPSPRPVAHTIMGGLEAPAADRIREGQLSPQTLAGGAQQFPLGPGPGGAQPRPGMPEPDRGLTDPPAGVSTNRWRVALTKQDLRWMSTAEITEAYRVGAVQLETFVFRTGMPTWVTLLEVPEIAEALAGARADRGGPPAPPPRRSPSSRPPPRKAAARNGEQTGPAGEEPLTAGGDTDEAPFALIAERGNARDEGPAAPVEATAGAAVPAQVEALARPAPPAGPPPPGFPAEPSHNPLRDAAPEPPEAAASEPLGTPREGNGTHRWLWIVIAVVLLGVAIAALLGPRLGLSLL